MMVQKIKLNGELCAKSARVLQDLEQRNLLSKIHQFFIADARDIASTGYKLATQHKVDTAPFFIVTLDNGSTRLYTTYLRFLREVLDQAVCAKDENAEVIEYDASLDFI